MARLLLVDDNPSIHKIAETLLGASYVQLVCVESAEAALALLDAGESFDIALLDTAMPGMDGWELLARLRANPATARIPVAMMAGVLDTVDPARLESAPIQGFLKKPIELRDLPDRVRQLLGTPVSVAQAPPPAAMPEFVPTRDNLPEPPSPYATQPPGTPLPHFGAPVDPADLETLPPGTKLSDLPGTASPDPGDLVTMPPGTKLSDLPGLSPGATTPGLQLDLLLLTPEDLLAEEPVLAAEPALDLEELDLDSLRNLPLEEAAAAPGPAVAEALPTWDELPAPPEATAPPEAFPLDLPEAPLAADGFQVVTGEVLGIPAAPEPDFFPPAESAPFDAAGFAAGPEPMAAPAFPEPGIGAAALEPAGDEAPMAVGLPPSSAHLPPIQTLDLDAGVVPSLDAWPPQAAEPEPFHPLSAALGAGAAAPAAAPVLARSVGQPEPPASLGHGPEADLLQALLDQPALMDALARAVVARLGDQVLREIAWDVMPELAEKLQRRT